MALSMNGERDTLHSIERPAGDAPPGHSLTSVHAPLPDITPKEGSIMKKVLVGLALALTLSACGGIQKAADAVAGTTSAPVTQATSTQAEQVREWVNTHTTLDWTTVPDSLIDQLGNQACRVAGSDLDSMELNALVGVTVSELGVSNDDALDVLATLIYNYCPGTTINGQAF
jgi:uncharacterized protein YceK